MRGKLSITIGRQCGSGGKEIGKRVGELLNFSVYDKEVLRLAAQKNGINEEALRRVEEKATNSLLYTIATGASLYGKPSFGTDLSISDRLFVTQTDVIKRTAERENCVFIGHCADYILRNHEHRISVFVYADIDARVSRICQTLGIAPQEALSLIMNTDKRRMNYYGFYTGKKWGKPENYHFLIDSTCLGIECAARVVATIAQFYIDKTNGLT